MPNYQGHRKITSRLRHRRLHWYAKQPFSSLCLLLCSLRSRSLRDEASSVFPNSLIWLHVHFPLHEKKIKNKTPKEKENNSLGFNWSKTKRMLASPHRAGSPRKLIILNRCATVWQRRAQAVATRRKGDISAVQRGLTGRVTQELSDIYASLGRFARQIDATASQHKSPSGFFFTSWRLIVVAFFFSFAFFCAASAGYSQVVLLMSAHLSLYMLLLHLFMYWLVTLNSH